MLELIYLYGILTINMSYSSVRNSGFSVTTKSVKTGQEGTNVITK